MKKTISLILLVAIAIFGIQFLKTAAPFMPIAGNSMEPVLKKGDLIIIGSVSPSQVKEGDVIVFNVPAPIQEHYNYPPVVAHRVIKKSTDGGIIFRTKGDNTAEDPFAVLASDVRGQVRKQIPYLGYLIFFLQSRQGLIFAIVALLLFAFYLYGSDLSRVKSRLQREIFAPIIGQNEMLERRIEATEQALTKFGSSIELYAQHLQSHTSAIIGLSEAAQDLKRSARQQNEFLAQLREAIERRNSDVGDTSDSSDSSADKNKEYQPTNWWQTKIDESLQLCSVQRRQSETPECSASDKTGMTESFTTADSTLLNKISQAYEDHYAENNKQWQSRGLPRWAELKNRFLEELRRQSPTGCTELESSLKGRGEIAGLFRKSITKAYVIGYMQARGWVSSLEQMSIDMHLGDQLAVALKDGIRGMKLSGMAFAASFAHVSLIGTMDACAVGAQNREL